MANMDIFNNNAFSLMSLTDAIEKFPYQPVGIGALNIFESKPIRTTTVAFENRDNVLALIMTSERGAPPRENLPVRRTMRNFSTVRLAKEDTIYADEIFAIRAFGSETEVQQAQQEVMRRSAQIVRDMELTKENMRVGAVQGIVLDADGSTIVNWFTAWGITPPTEIDFDLDNAAPVAGVLRDKTTKLIRAVRKASKGAWTPNTYVRAICGDNFFDALLQHSEIRNTFLTTPQAATLREGIPVWGVFEFGGVLWENYRGTDDGTTVGVATDKAKFFPVNAPGVFQVAWSPGEWYETVNTPGREEYVKLIPDRDRDAWVKVEHYSYPLYVCTRPEMLQTGRMT